MMRFNRALLIPVLVLSSAACSSEEEGGPGPLPGGAEQAGTGNTAGAGGVTPGAGGAAAGTGGRGSGGSTIAFGGAQSSGGASEPGAGGSCASENARAKVEPVYLAFAFDVSGSMGEGDYPWHDRTLKWDPVVAATKAFFQDAPSQGLHASMTFFPAAEHKCEDATYRTPNVPMTPLPSTEFGRVLDERGSQTWRGGTPTAQVLRGVIDFVQEHRLTTPGRYAIVLVTDGHPQDCEDNQIEDVVSEARAIAADIPTYVVGVKNPPIDDAPDTVSSLTDIALAGGTERAYIIDTGNPAQTTADFRATIDAIRGAAVSCDVAIPTPPDGRVFDKEKVAVTYRSGGASNALTYDPACTGAASWQYDDSSNPTQIRLCPATCGTLQNDASAELFVEFTCETRIVIPR
ncbi:MAG TPA: vWA domain-containing protein [Polyangiaceae bacterium]